MKFKIILILLTVLCVVPEIYSQKSPLWITRYNGKGDYSDKINCMVSDTSGVIYLSGYSVNIGQNRDVLVMKVNASGDTLWRRTYNGPGNGVDEGLAIVLDPLGNILVSGFQKGDGTGDDILTLKYNANGTLLWSKIYNYAANEDDKANSLAVNSGGDVYIAGQSDGDPSLVTNDDYVLIKYNSQGIQQWVQRYNGYGNGTDRAVKVKLDVQGNVIVTGRSENYWDDDYLTIKYNAIGEKLWEHIYDGSADDRAVDLAIDGSSNIYVTGRSDNGDSDDYITLKISPSGSQLWQKQYDGTGAGHDRPTAMCIDANDNIYVTGQSDVSFGTAKNYNFLTIKYNSSGTQQWTVTYNGSGNGDDIPAEIYADINGNVYVTGESDSNPSATIVNKDFATIKYNSAGTQQWVKSYNGTANLTDNPSAIFAGNSGQVYVSGGSQNTDSQKDAILICYDASGVNLWIKIYAGQGDNYDNTNAITTDGSGNVYIAGYSVNYETDRDMLTMKINPSGDTLWTRKFNGTSNFVDEATAIHLDGQGNVYVTGYTKNTGTSNDFTTIKYNSLGDTLWLRKYNSPYSESDKAWALDLDNAGNVYVTGESDQDVSIASNDDFCTLKYSADGTLQWVKRFNGTSSGTDRAIALKIGISGNIYVSGRSSNGSDDDIMTLKYNPAGILLWASVYDGEYGDDQPTDMILDNSENLYITGTSTNISGNDDDYMTLKYNIEGSQLWAARYNGAGSGDDRPKAMGIDDQGNVYVTGESDVDNSSLVKNYNYLTIKYNSSGNEQWINSYNGLANGDDVASGIALDDSNNVYITGQCDNGTGAIKNYDFVTIRYNSAGSQQWYTVYNGPGNGSDGANVITFQNNSIFVAGGSWGTETQRDIAVLKYVRFPNGIFQREVLNQEFTLFPVPANQLLQIQGNQDLNVNQITITDISGVLQFQQKFANLSKTTLNVSILKNGIYLICINNLYFYKFEIVR